MDQPAEDKKRDAVMTNAGIRLHGLLSTVAQAKSGPTWKVFAKAMQIRYDAATESEAILAVAAALPVMVRELEAVKFGLKHKYDDPSELDTPISQLQSALVSSSNNLAQDFSSVRGMLTPEILTALKYLARDLPKDEPVLESIDLQKLSKNLREARDAIVKDDSLDLAFKRILLDLIEQLEKALTAYAFGGVKEVRDALRSFWFSMMAASGEIKRNQGSSSVQLVVSALSKAWAATKFVVELKEAGEIFKLLHEHVWDAAQRLLT
jgi:hypothetical protein